MARTKSDDGPTITVKVEKGKLVPVSAHDQELINHWREGAVLNVDPSLTLVRPLEKRYFAMLSHLIREADTPWTNTITAHESIKLATGFVTPTKRKNGLWKPLSRHISSFTDAELSEFYELFCGIVRERFGIDPETLQRASADTGLESSGTPSETGRADDAPGAGPIPVGVGEPETPAVEASTAGAPEAGDVPGSIPRGASSADGLSPAELAWLKQTARMLVAATSPNGDVGIVDRQVQAIKANLTPPNIGRSAKDIAQEIYRHCRTVTKGDKPLDAQWVAYTAHCNPTDLRAEAR